MKTLTSLPCLITALIGFTSAAVLPSNDNNAALRPVQQLDEFRTSLSNSADVRQAPSQASPTILKPIHRPGVQPGHLLDLEARQTDGKTGTPVILKPIPRPQVLKTGLATSLQARQEALVPAKKIILGYAAAGMAALVDVAMKQPAVALEEVAGITSVKCTSAAVSMKFSNAAAVKAASTAWPKSNFIIITYSPDGGCNTADERGFYTVSALKFDEASLTATASAVRSALDKQSEDAVVEFDTTTAPAKRDFQSSIGGEINGTLVDTKNLKIVVDKAKYESNIRIKGGFRFNFLKFKPSKMYLDVDYSGLVNLNISTTVAASFSSKLYNYEPLSASVSAFSIPGILDVGPIAQFALGVEFAASGTVNATLGLQSEIVNGQVHLDLLDSNKSSTSGWKPKTTVSSDVSAEVSLQLNPYLDLNLALGIRVFKGVIDLTTGFEVKPQVINAFSADLDFAYASTSGITFTKPAAATCPNGAWFASTFNMDVIAYVGTLYSKTLFNVNAPIFQSKCWNFAG